MSLKWNLANRAESYNLQVSVEPDFSSTVIDESGITSTNKAIGGLLNGTSYYWRIRAKNSGGTSDWSEVWSFTTKNIVGINEFSFDEQIKVFPNPARNILYFEGIENEGAMFEK